MLIQLAFLTLAPVQNPAPQIAPRPDFNLVETPKNAASIMVSDAYAEIGWDAATAATAYKIQIRKTGFDHHTVLQLEEKTVWTSFWFRVADLGATYEFRLAALENDQQSDWTEWTILATQTIETASKN